MAISVFAPQTPTAWSAGALQGDVSHRAAVKDPSEAERSCERQARRIQRLAHSADRCSQLRPRRGR